MADPDPMTCDPGSRVYDPDPGTVIPDPIYLVTTLLFSSFLIHKLDLFISPNSLLFTCQQSVLSHCLFIRAPALFNFTYSQWIRN